MSCETIREFIATDFVDGVATPEVKQTVESHLTTCDACRQFASEVDAGRRTLQRAGRLEVPDHLWPKIKSKILEDEVKQTSRWRSIFTAKRLSLLIPTLAAAVFVIVIFPHYGPAPNPNTGWYLAEELGLLDEAAESESEASSGSFGTVIEEFLIA